MNKTKSFKNKTIITTLFILAVLLLMPANIQAAKKPGKVKKLEEVSATDTSIKIKFKKVKGAKSYQIRVYEASRKREKKVGADGKKTYTYKWVTGKKLVKKMETKKTTCTVKGLGQSSGYAIKVRAYNGKSYGKWETMRTYLADKKGMKRPGMTTATGKNLKKQYDLWKSQIVKDARLYKGWERADAIVGYPYIEHFKCTEYVNQFIADPNQYSMDEVCETFKKGEGTSLELYHVVMDICKDAGMECRIKKWRSKYTGKTQYTLVVYTGDYDEWGAGGCTLSISPGSQMSSSDWHEKMETEDGWE